VPGLTAWNRQALNEGRISALEADPPPALTTGQRVRGGVAVLNRQAVSPFNAFVEYRLGAAELRRPGMGIQPMERGILTHAALEAFYAAVPDRASAAALSVAQREAILRPALEQVLRSVTESSDAALRYLAEVELRQQLTRLHAFLDVDLARDDFTVVACEAQHDVTIGPVSLRLKLDRLDRLASGGLLVIDYKTGRVDRQSWNPDRPRDLQLPLYATAIAPDAVAIAFAQVAAQQVGYDGVGDDSVTGVPGLRSPGRRVRVQVRYQYPRSVDIIESWSELRRIWREVLETLASEFAGGDVRIDPRNPDSGRGQFAVLSRVYDAGADLSGDDE
jgi:hypothetical protein